MNQEAIKARIRELAGDTHLDSQAKLERICETLRQSVPYYDWVGFYFHEDDRAVLSLKAFAGEPTEHTEIPFGKGICGQVALSNQNFVVPDVAAQDNYIACSMDVKSEIVVPIFVEGKNIGQIDIDSHSADPFDKNDELLLEFVTAEVAKIL